MLTWSPGQSQKSPPPPLPAGVASRFADVGEVRLHYLEKGSGPLILMLHGFPEYSGIWQPYLAKLGDDFRVVAPDLRGYNLSEQPEERAAYDLERLLGDVTGLVKALGERQVCLVGHDWGGILAWYLADLYPETFTRLVIMNAPHPAIYRRLYAEDPDQKRKGAYVPGLLLPGSEFALAALDFALLRRGVAHQTARPLADEEMAGLVAAWRRGLRGPVNYYRQYFPHMDASVARLRGIKVPTLVLWGERDAALSLHNLDGLEEHVAHLTVRRFPEATHWLMYEIPDELATAVRDFCR